MEPVTPNDVYRHRHLQDISGATEHGRVAFVMSRASRSKGGYRSTAWLIDTSSQQNEQDRNNQQNNQQNQNNQNQNNQNNREERR